MQRAVAQGLFGLDADQPRQLHTGGQGRRVVQQPRLADPGLAHQHQDAAESVPHRFQQLSDCFAFGTAADQRPHRPG
nr:hypothetical protein [Kitasatospora aureofaciens]